MKTTYDTTTKADGEAARDRLLAKARKPDPLIRDLGRMNRAARPRSRANEYTELVPDSAPE